MGLEDEGTDWPRQLLIGLSALVAVSLLIGGVVGVVALGAAKVTGLSGSNPEGPSKPSLYMPSLSPPATSSAGTPGPTVPAPEGPSESATPAAPEISLQALPLTVTGLQRIDLAGVYPRGEGRTLQVQRFQAGWVDFPVTATVRGKVFATYVVTARVGKNRFRVLDKATGTASNPVTVQVR